MNRWSQARPFILGLALALAGCGGGGNDLPDSPNPPVNTPPTANAGPDQVVAPGATVNLNGGGSSDANGTIASYAWTQTAGAAVTLGSPATATPSFIAPTAPGTLTFQLTVTDNGGASHSDSVSVTVNAIPVANAGADQTVSAGAAVSLAGSATDADGSIASYAWTQTSGPAVTLLNANGATATFTAPASAATLGFDLTVTDNRGATHVDSVVVTVTAIVNPPVLLAPSIGQQPNNPRAIEHGSAMLVVAAAGSDLTYEWRRASGTVVKSGPEPYLLLAGLSTNDDDDCYYVVVSNDLGTATSEQGCLTVENIDWYLDPSDDPDSNDDYGYALGFGEGVMKMTQTVTGPLTGSVGGQLGFPLQFGPPESCYMGSYGGTTIDGVPVAAEVAPPLGHHTLSESWNECYTDADDTRPQNGAYLVEYDFPQAWGVGTLTLHVSEPYFNGTLQAEVVTSGSGTTRAEEFQITILEDFSFGELQIVNDKSIDVERRYASDGISVDEADVIFHVSMAGFDANGSVGTLTIRGNDIFHLRQHFAEGDSGEPEFSSTGTLLVEIGRYALALLQPSGTYQGWGVRTVPPEECPADVCADLPE
ncbi:MAG TPA: PKD domain-containing protein [Steroidobacteraceae bacterium]|nr:PKD domain-containing protein [Steroidobacteraceae bacterium]